MPGRMCTLHTGLHSHICITWTYTLPAITFNPHSRWGPATLGISRPCTATAHALSRAISTLQPASLDTPNRDHLCQQTPETHSPSTPGASQPCITTNTHCVNTPNLSGPRLTQQPSLPPPRPPPNKDHLPGWRVAPPQNPQPQQPWALHNMHSIGTHPLQTDKRTTDKPSAPKRALPADTSNPQPRQPWALHDQAQQPAHALSRAISTLQPAWLHRPNKDQLCHPPPWSYSP
jgi:hypothetical protein